jgi:predicted NAD/FAD-binding protein
MKIAVIGGGISGLGSALILQQKHEVHLFESATRLGGHAHTYHVPEGEKNIPIDVGFLVYNELTYPHFTAMLRYLGVETCDSDMSLSVRSDQENMEWAGDNLKTVFAQKRNLFRPQFLRMLKDVIRFHKLADETLEKSRQHRWTLGEMLEQGGYSEAFANWYLLPMAGAIWSTPVGNMRQFPAESFFTFCMNHRLLQVNDRPQWRTIVGGSEKYVQNIERRLSHIHLNSPVESVERGTGQIRLRTRGQEILFDKVVFATHVPVTRSILRSRSAEEEAILGCFSVQPNTAVLHHDDRDMPKRKSCWASWNVLTGSAKSDPSIQKMSLTYYINRLQPLGSKKNRFVTLNPVTPLPDADESFSFDHPYFDQRSLQAQKDLNKIQGAGGVYYTGAWTRYGFHEDGLLSAVNMARLLDVVPPWKTT